MYREAELVLRCGRCGAEVAISRTDATGKDTGYLCERCAGEVDVASRRRQADAKRADPWTFVLVLGVVVAVIAVGLWLWAGAHWEWKHPPRPKTASPAPAEEEPPR